MTWKKPQQVSQATTLWAEQDTAPGPPWSGMGWAESSHPGDVASSSSSALIFCGALIGSPWR